MKNIIFALLVMISINSFCQQTKTFRELTATDYLQKSKQQQTTAWLLVAGGFLVGTGGMFMALDNTFGDNGNYNISKTRIGVVMFYTGGLAVIGSIPVFISAARNKGRSMSVGLKMEKKPIIQQAGLTNTYYPAISFKLAIK
ncbi:MAG: hypothetical protein ABJA85_01785 [Bacteroidota bacterium]